MNPSWSLGPGTAGLASVIVTAFNQDWVLAETLASVTEQTYRPLECVIVDDGSTDGTSEVISTFVRQHNGPLIRPIRQSNQGAQAARNAGVRASKGKFVQFLDGDDILSREKLTTQIDFLQSNEGMKVDVVYGDARWLHQQQDMFCPGETIGLGPTTDVLAGLLRLVNFNPPFSYVCRRTAIERCGGWDGSLKINDDVEYFLRMACCSLESGQGFAYVPVMTGFYRTHSKPRISKGGMLLRSETTLAILKDIERKMKATHLFTPARRLALGEGYYEVSSWASRLNKSIWEECLDHAIRLHPHLTPRRMLSRCLQRALGFRTSESVKRLVRQARDALRSSNVPQ